MNQVAGRGRGRPAEALTLYETRSSGTWRNIGRRPYAWYSYEVGPLNVPNAHGADWLASVVQS